MSKSINDERLSTSSCQHSTPTRRFSKIPNTVLVFGVFDLLHPGHHYFLSAAKEHGERLVVVVTRDDRAEHEKGRRPINNLVTRIGTLMALPFVDGAMAGDKIGEWGTVRKIQPDVICIGHDQRADHPKFLAQLEDLNPVPRIVQLAAHDRDKYSTTRLRSELLG